MRVAASLVLCGLLLTTGCGDDESGSGGAAATCTSLLIVREMAYEATVPAEVQAETMQLELCIGITCETLRLVTSPTARGLLTCEHVDANTPTFATTCTFAQSSRTLSLKTNTVYGGHEGSDPLLLTAVASGGPRTELLRGTVTYRDTTDDAARGACTKAWEGTFAR